MTSTSTEIVLAPKAEIEILYGPHESRREKRERERRERRALAKIILGGCATVVVATMIAAGMATASQTGAAPVEPTPKQAQEMAAIAVAESAPTTWPEPDPIPAQTKPGWETIQVRTPGGETLGRLITDGKRADRVFPGDIGTSVISVDGAVDLSKAASVVVGGVEWLIFHRGEIDAAYINPLLMEPTLPVVTLIMETPTAKRPYVEMRLK